jgi:hypothetical protein
MSLPSYAVLPPALARRAIAAWGGDDLREISADLTAHDAGRHLRWRLFPDWADMGPEDFRRQWCSYARDWTSEAARALGMASPEQRVTLRREDLLPLLADEDPSVRMVAVCTLGQLTVEHRGGTRSSLPGKQELLLPDLPGRSNADV